MQHHDHTHTENQNTTSSFIIRHLVLLIVAGVILFGLFYLSRSLTTTSIAAAIFIGAHIAIATGVLFGGRALLRGFIQKIHGPPPSAHDESAPHSHDYADLETEGYTLNWARFYDVFVPFMLLGKQKKFMQSIIALANIQSNEKVLDVGCGTGTLALATKRHVPANVEIYGRDAAPEMIERARQKAHNAGLSVDFKAGLVENIQFPDDTFDLVMNSLMVHHLPGDLKTRGFAEMFRVLKPNGRLLIIDFEPPKKGFAKIFMSIFIRPMMQIDNSGLPALLREVGFINVEMAPTQSGFTIYVAGTKPSA